MTIDASNRDHTHHIAIFFAEQRDSAGFDSRLITQLLPDNRRIGTDPGIDASLDLVQLFRGQRARMRKVETQAIGCNERASLGGMFAEHITQRAVEQVRCRMVAHNGGATPTIDVRVDRIVQHHAATLDHAIMNNHAGHGSLHIFDPDTTARTDQDAGITDLTTAFSIERRAVERDLHLLTGAGFGDLIASDDIACTTPLPETAV
jgi:hypothetical protein